MSECVEISIIIPKDVFTYMESTRILSGSEDMTELIKRSLALYDAFVEMKVEGGRLIVEHPDGSQEVLSI